MSNPPKKPHPRVEKWTETPDGGLLGERITKRDTTSFIHIDGDYYRNKAKFKNLQTKMEFRRALKDRLMQALDALPENTPIEVELQYLTALTVIENPEATPHMITMAMKNVGEVRGLYKKVVDLTAHQGGPKEEGSIVEFIKSFPDELKRQIAEEIGVGHARIEEHEQDESEDGDSGTSDQVLSDAEEGDVPQSSGKGMRNQSRVPEPDREGQLGTESGLDSLSRDLFGSGP